MIRRFLLATVVAAFVASPPALSGAAPPDWAVGVFPSGSEFSLEVAADPDSRARGYMFREHVGEREGMLFIFDEPARHSIWMKNCRVPLDIIWLDATFRVIDIRHDQPPCPAAGDCPLLVPASAASYVLEVAGGTSRAQNLAAGDTVVILSDPPIRP